ITDEIKQFLANLKLADLPPSVARSFARGRNDNSHWCCTNEQPITTTTHTKMDKATHVVATKTLINYVNCGFMGTMRCSQYITRYR
ncbi:unnamed protein product, partial [Didymodactylos carnosus]